MWGGEGGGGGGEGALCGCVYYIYIYMYMYIYIYIYIYIYLAASCGFSLPSRGYFGTPASFGRTAFMIAKVYVRGFWNVWRGKLKQTYPKSKEFAGSGVKCYDLKILKQLEGPGQMNESYSIGWRDGKRCSAGEAGSKHDHIQTHQQRKENRADEAGDPQQQRRIWRRGLQASVHATRTVSGRLGNLGETEMASSPPAHPITSTSQQRGGGGEGAEGPGEEGGRGSCFDRYKFFCVWAGGPGPLRQIEMQASLG